jgi:hypothetical protein
LGRTPSNIRDADQALEGLIAPQSCAGCWSEVVVCLAENLPEW